MNKKTLWIMFLLISFLGVAYSLAAENPKRLSDICPGTCAGSPYNFVEFKGKLYFVASDGVSGFELWVSDGINPPTMVADIYPGATGSNPSYFKVFQDKLYFKADDDTHGTELWVYDGSNPPTIVADIWPGLNPSTPSYLTVFNNRLYFSASNGSSGYELFEYDGVNAPRLTADINPGSSSSSPYGLTVYNGKLYFSADDGVHGRELWEYDGVLPPRMVADINTNMGSSPYFFTEFMGELYFRAQVNDGSFELWKHDGLNPPIRVSFPQANPNPRSLTVFNYRLYFYARDSVVGWELWSFDGIGTPAPVADINPGVNDAISQYSPSNMITYSGKLYFQATNGVSGFELWSYDGINVPQIVSDINPGAANANPANLYTFNNRLFFSADDGVHGKELWVYETDSVTVIAPNGGESWEGGSSHNITWSSTGTIDNVKLEYSTDGGSTWNTITNSTANSGSYNWTVPNSPASNCLLKVSNVASAVTDTSNSTFIITAQRTITVTAPNGGESWEGGSTQNITWSSTGAINNVKLEYSIDGGSTWNTITNSTANSGSYNWTVPNSPASNCLLKVSDTASVVTDTSDSTFIITAQRTITVTAPNGGESWRIGTYQYIRWNWTGAISNVKIEYSTNNGSTWKIIASSTANTGSYRWKVTSPASTNCKVKVSVITGSPSDISNNVFRIRN